MQRLENLTTIHKVFGYSGLIPFIGLALAIILEQSFSDWLLSYAALIFSFLGGVLWTYSLSTEAPRHVSWVSIGAMLWAWLWLVCEPHYLFLLAGGSFVLLHIYERLFLKQLFSHDFMDMRLHLSTIAAVCLITSHFFV